MDVLNVIKKDRIIIGEVTLPLSKSISNRLLIIHAIAGFDHSHFQSSDAGDSILLHHLLNTIRSNQNLHHPVEIDCQNAGTVFRFLTALLAVTPGKWLLTGSVRMKERPVRTLVDALRQLGAEINYQTDEGYPPVFIAGRQISGGQIRIDSDTSSQFVSALLMIAPVLPGGLEISLNKPVISLPYIHMTLRLMEYYGIWNQFEDGRIIIPEQHFEFNRIAIEHDWSSASFWYEMVAFSEKADLLIKNLTKESLQGDAILPELFDKLGVRTRFFESGVLLSQEKMNCSRFDFDFTDFPDLALPVIVTCAGLNIPFRISGLKNLRIKESDRISAVMMELQKLGITTHLIKGDTLAYDGKNLMSKPKSELSTINVYNDHRMAMAFAPVALLLGSVEIENPDVVVKSYPGFWEEVEKMGFSLNLRN